MITLQQDRCPEGHQEPFSYLEALAMLLNLHPSIQIEDLVRFSEDPK